MVLRVERFVGAEVRSYLPELARLRIEVFREWPYLYDGSFEYEQTYLESYLAPEAMVAIAFDTAGTGQGRVVGASTALPLTAHHDVQVPALSAVGLGAEQIYYFGESVLEARFRRLGIGHRFFELREAFARSLGYEWAAFCAVERPKAHPLRPPDYVPHDAFWTKRGFVRHAELVSSFSWKDLGDEAESSKPMVYWLKSLNALGA
jgi:GNAT superfamily N-acetyltransferase